MMVTTSMKVRYIESEPLNHFHHQAPRRLSAFGGLSFPKSDGELLDLRHAE